MNPSSSFAHQAPPPASGPAHTQQTGRWWKLPVGAALGLGWPFALIFSLGSAAGIFGAIDDVVTAYAYALALWLLGYAVLIGLLFWRRAHWLAIGGLIGMSLTPLALFVPNLLSS